MHVEVSERAPAPFIALAWDEFFASRNRGVSFAAHFPWLNDAGVWCVTAWEDGELLGGLIVRPTRGARDGLRAGLVGLVVVALPHRGRGVSGLLMTATIQEARRRELDDLILWTGTPGVYRRYGFVPQDSGLFGTVTRSRGNADGRQGLAGEEIPWPGPNDGRGLPAFAIAARRRVRGEASLILVEDAQGLILAEWSGADRDILSLIADTLPDSWRLNALEGDTLLAGLASDGWSLDLKETGNRMILPLGPHSHSSDCYPLRILDRI